MTRSCAKSWCACGEWGEAHMGSAYDFNLLMYFLALRHTVLTWLSRSLCLPSVSLTRPLSPLLSPFALACSCCLAWFPLLLHRWKLLSFTVLKRMRKRVATKEYVRRLRGSVSQNLISDLVCTSFGPRLNCSQSKPSPERFWKGFAMPWNCGGW